MDRRVAVSGLVAVAAFAAVGLLGRERVRSAPEPAAALPAGGGSAPGFAPSPGTAGRRPTVPGDGANERCEALLAELRSLAADEGFHGRAWPLVGELAAWTRRSAGAAAAVRSVVDDPAEHERVRGACLVALGGGDGGRARELASGAPLEQAELERAAWLVLGRARPVGTEAPGGVPSPLALDGFRSSTGEVGFPALVEGGASRGDVALAVGRLTRPVGEEFHAVGATDLPGVRAETFTREVALLCVLGPRAAQPGEERETLLRWVGARRLPERLVREAALFALALAARDDGELARRLVRTLVGTGREGGTAELLGTLVRIPGSEGAALEVLRDLFRDPGLAGDLWSLVQAVDALGELLLSEDPEAARGAAELAVERLLDTGLDPIQRAFFLDRLAAAGGELVYEVSELVLATEDDPDVVADLLPFLADVPAERRAAALDLLVAGYDVDGPRRVREATIATVAKLGGAEAEAFLTQVAAVDPDPDLRALAGERLAALRRGR